MYFVVQVLNNNVAIVIDKKKDKAIAVGKGIAFQKKKGDVIEEESIDNLFVLKDKQSGDHFSTLLKDVPVKFIMIAYEIIDNAINKYDYSVQDYIYVTLTDHIYWNYQKIKNNDYQVNTLPSIENQYPVEYRIATEAVDIMNESLSNKFPKDEINNVALHFINAKGKGKIAQDNNLEKEQEVLNKITDELKDNGIYRNTANQNFYDRLIIHINYMLKRGNDELSTDEFTSKMDKEVQQIYPKAYLISEKICKIVEEQFEVILNNNERVYLTFHIQRLINK